MAMDARELLLEAALKVFAEHGTRAPRRAASPTPPGSTK